MATQPLILYTSTHSINPSYSAVYRELDRYPEDACHAVDVSQLSMASIDKAIERAEVIALDGFLVNAQALSPPHKESVAFRVWRGMDFYRELVDRFCASDAVRILLTSGIDLHWDGPESYVQKMLGIVDGAAWIYINEIPQLDSIQAEWRDPWMLEHHDPSVVKLNIENQSTNIIEWAHCIDDSEFSRPKSRFWDSAVTGVPYRTRQIAIESAKRQQLSVAPYRKFDSALIRGWRYMPRQLARPSVLGTFNSIRYANMRTHVQHSSLAWVDGSAYRYPVRKFMEIPAWGTPMICLPHSRLGDLGFKDQLHYLSSTPEGFGGEARRLLRKRGGLVELAEMAQNAREVVSTRHSASARASQLVWALNILCEHPLTKFRWTDGDFIAERGSLSSSVTETWTW